MPPVVLTIAASDPLGGAGVQADLTTFAAFGVHGASAITAVTAQTLASMTASAPVPADVVAAQIDAVAADLGPRGVKTGLLSRAEVVRLVAERVRDGVLTAPVVDPVMVDGRGARFVSAEVEQSYRETLFPLARVLTPNRAEAELLVGVELPSAEAVLDQASSLRSLGAGAVVVTGGGFDGPPDDVVITRSGSWVTPGPRIRSRNVRGSGCTFSAALASALATSDDLAAAVAAARAFVRQAIATSASWRLGAPHLDHEPKPQHELDADDASAADTVCYPGPIAHVLQVPSGAAR